MNLPANIYSVESVRSIDHAAINSANIKGYTLMTRAAQSALDLILQQYPDAGRWQIICGAGNNAGDGYVLARLAAQQGIVVSVISAAPPESLQGDAETAYLDFRAEIGVLADYEGNLDSEAELLVDALLGSGIQRDVTGRFAEVIEAINAHAAPVLALDLPSGLNGDSGVIMGCAVRADVTITFVGLKTGLFVNDGPEYAGTIAFADLEIPDACYSKQDPKLRRIDKMTVAKTLKPRRRNSHKGDFGHVLVVGGGPGMSGAAQLCAYASLRAGAGLVTLATHPSHSNAIASARPELMCHGVETAGELDALLSKADVVALGPGLGRSEWAIALHKKVLESGKPLVIDADGLNLLAESAETRQDWILTPHPGEAARLLGINTTEIQSDRRQALALLQNRYGGTIVLKGSGTLVSSTDGPCWLCSAGNPGMSAPGMGDVLTGVIAAFVGQGLPRPVAATAGVHVHATAGDAAAINGQRGMIASDLIAHLRERVNQ